jgi:hypothetical protein
MRHPFAWTLTGVAALGLLGLGARRVASDRRAVTTEAYLLDGNATLPTFSVSDLAGLPEPAQRYLRHAVAFGTPLYPSVRAWMDGTMTPQPGGTPVALTATESLAPRTGFVWTAHARMNGLPTRVRDHYFHHTGEVNVVVLGVVPIPMPTGDDVARSSRHRLVAEAVWCPTALIHPSVRWQAVDENRAQFSLAVDGEPISVTIHVDAEGALREVTLDRWGNVDGDPWRPIRYGFRVDDEQSFDGVTIPTRLSGGWHYGTERFDPATVSSFTVHRAEFARRSGM